MIAQILTFHLMLSIALAARFKDVSIDAGMQRPLGRRRKYGGAAIADLDGDGFPDLLFQHHDEKYAEVYFNNQDGTFIKSKWGAWEDVHALSPFRLSPYNPGMHFMLTMGGGNGNKLRSPKVYEVLKNRTIEIVEEPDILSHGKGRGRSALFMSLRKGNRNVDAILTNINGGSKEKVRQPFFKGSPGGFSFKKVTKGFALEANAFATVTDVDGDGQVEVVSYHDLRIYKLFSDFDLRDISTTVLPPEAIYSGTAAVAEIDFDNDGKWDLYIARTNTGDLKWLKGAKKINPHQRDYLLRNVGGRYIDVSTAAGIPTQSQTRGVTAGDFNNDGYTDLLLIRYEMADVLLMNNGDGTFRTVDAGLNRPKFIRGDMATAVDYDRDGKLDVIVSEGDWVDKKSSGFYRVMKNVGVAQSHVLVRVMNSPTRRATSLHAVVTVKTDKHSMMRRVGSPGTGVSNSYIELLHFGIGDASTAKVSIRWTSGERVVFFSVSAGRLVTFGS